MPRRQVFRFGHTLEERAYIWISPGVCDERGIVDIPTFPSPGIEHYLFPRVIGMQSGDHTLHCVVEERGANSYLFVESEIMSAVEERFVLLNGLPFVVEDGPTRSEER